ncbi:Immunoglobulin-like domain [Trinorchestia longiramus]|nr:Immunoglobulin-like domain [Trinorchestia longiramus]
MGTTTIPSCIIDVAKFCQVLALPSAGSAKCWLCQVLALTSAGSVKYRLTHKWVLMHQPSNHTSVCDPPVVSLRPGRSLNLSAIEEGDDIYFECIANASPPIYKIVWYHQGQVLHHNVSGGVILSNQSLVLQRVDRAASGNYSCTASNIEGDGTSNAVQLSVKCKAVAP